MVNRYPSEGYVRLLQIIALAAIVGLAWTLAENEKIKEEEKPPICMVDSPGIPLCLPEKE